MLSFMSTRAATIASSRACRRLRTVDHDDSVTVESSRLVCTPGILTTALRSCASVAKCHKVPALQTGCACLRRLYRAGASRASASVRSGRQFSDLGQTKLRFDALTVGGPAT
jgi:hypothetical protein